MWRRLDEYLEIPRKALAGLLGADHSAIALVPNTTTGINIVARSLKLGPGDEVLTTDHEYGAIDRTWRFITRRRGAAYITRKLALPLATEDDFIEQFWSGVTERTKVISISHMTSPTALIFPLARICRRAREAGIITIIDGAHVPGHIAVNLTDLGADFYTGNCHKWLCSPRGAGFLYARPDMQPLIEPLVVSWGYEAEQPSGSTFQDYLGWVGTSDVSPYMAIEAAIRFQNDHDWDSVRRRCHGVAVELRQRLLDRFGEPAPANGDQWFAQMFAVRLPDKIDHSALESTLLNEYHIEVPIKRWNDQNLLRVSIQGYNTGGDISALESALEDLI